MDRMIDFLELLVIAVLILAGVKAISPSTSVDSCLVVVVARALYAEKLEKSLLTSTHG